MATGTFLRNLNNWPAIDGFASPELVVASQGGRGAPAPFNERIRGYAIGRVADTQQRRRNALLETPSRINL